MGSKTTEFERKIKIYKVTTSQQIVGSRITISISRVTHKRLVEGAKYGESMDTIINSLLDKVDVVDKITKSQQNTGGKKKKSVVVDEDDSGGLIRSGFGYD